MKRFTFREVLGWELVRWVMILSGVVPGVIGVAARFVLFRFLFGGSNGFFRIFERVIVEYPRGLRLGRDVGINAGCWINARGGVSIGDNTILGPYCVIHSANHRIEQLNIPVQYQGYEHKAVDIGSNVWIAARVTVLPGVSIGDNVVIGAGSVITKDVPINAVVAGNPARVIRMRTDEAQ